MHNRPPLNAYAHLIFCLRSLLLLGILLGSAGFSPVSSQIREAEARMLLAERGIPEDTLRARLIRRGFDPDNIDPGQMAEFQSEIMAVIAEIEEENQDLLVPVDTIPGMGIRSDTQAVVDSSRMMPVRTPKRTGDKPDGPVPIYGQEIFSNSSIAVYQRSDDLVAPDEYILGPGDKLGVVGFGRSQFEHLLVINADGFVTPDRMPRMLLRGLTLKEARLLLFQRYSQFFAVTRSEFQVTLQQARLMTVNVFGEVETPGSYTLPAINTAFNLLAAAGGPTKIGSVREIRLIRGGKAIPIDVYAFMENPGAAGDFFLQHNDYLHVPVARKVVEIQGAVVRPMMYELQDDENLISLLEFAGGAKASAYLTNVQVTRYVQDRKIVASVNIRDLAASGGDYVLLNGDVVTIRAVEETIDNVVWVQGAVSFPGKYAWEPELRVLNLLERSVLRPEARLDFAYLLRYNQDGTLRYEKINVESAMADPAGTDNSLLGAGDRLHIFSLKTYADSGSFAVVGAVRNPRKFWFKPDNQLRYAEAIQLAGGLSPDAADVGYIFRRNPKEPKTVQYVPVDVKRALEEPESPANDLLQAGDQLRVFSKTLRRDELKVSIFGSVRNPGEYEFGTGMTLTDLVNLAGGFSYDADYSRIDIARPEYKAGESLKIKMISAALPGMVEDLLTDTRAIPLAPFDHVYVRSIPEYELQQTVTLEGEVRYPGTYAILIDKERISDLLNRAGGLTGRAFPEGARLYRKADSIGLVVIDLVEVLRSPHSPSNIVLLDGDRIEIPKSRDLVTVTGFVNLEEAYSTDFLTGERSISVAYRGPKTAKHYIDHFAAGVSDEGAKSKIRVQYADGRVKRTQRFLFFKQYPKVDRGATIYVGQKKQRPPKTEAPRKTDWGTVLRDTMAGATSILTLLILVDQLSK